ncbi:MAG: YidC/Oxa1 family membrane protein insertase [Eubacteriales bacterium]|nr:YidC/Oxa1 family membrane protein insertase [Eubacteriales bacterium]
MGHTIALLSPVMRGVITMTLPAGLGLYEIIGNIFQSVQD